MKSRSVLLTLSGAFGFLCLTAQETDNGENVPETEYSVVIDSPADGDVVGAPVVASATATKTDSYPNGDVDEENVSGDITWGEGASGSGAESDEITGLGDVTIEAALTAEDESDSIDIKVVGKESFLVTSTSNQAGLRQVGSGETLVLVHSNQDRAASLEFSYLSGSSDVSGEYPKWSVDSGQLSNASDGSLTADFSDGAGDYVVTTEWATGEEDTVTISVVADEEGDATLTQDMFDELETNLNDGLDQFYGDLEGDKEWFEITGSVTGTKKYVDLFDDGSDKGDYYSASGGVSVALGDSAFTLDTGEKYLWPTICPPCFVRLDLNFGVVSASLNGSISYDESKSTSERVSGKLELNGGTGINGTLTGGVGSCDGGAGITGTASTSISISGGVESKEDKVEGSGKITISPIDIQAYIWAKLGPFQCTRDFEPLTIGTTVNFPADGWTWDVYTY